MPIIEHVQYHLTLGNGAERVTHIRPVVSVLARKSAKWDASVRICLTNDVGDGTNDRKCPQFPPPRKRQKSVLFQVCRAHFGAVCSGKLHLKESVVANKNDMVVCSRIEFVRGV